MLNCLDLWIKHCCNKTWKCYTLLYIFCCRSSNYSSIMCMNRIVKSLKVDYFHIFVTIFNTFPYKHNGMLMMYFVFKKCLYIKYVQDL